MTLCAYYSTFKVLFTVPKWSVMCFFDFIPFSSFYIYYSTRLVQFTEPIRHN
nr:MAG TPA: hypothetical protein [Caudoviricetes sp.]